MKMMLGFWTSAAWRAASGASSKVRRRVRANFMKTAAFKLNV
jgi:hypothetical protein